MAHSALRELKVTGKAKGKGARESQEYRREDQRQPLPLSWRSGTMKERVSSSGGGWHWANYKNGKKTDSEASQPLCNPDSAIS